MKKKILVVLVVLLVILVLAAAGVLGFMWYRDNHIFVEDAVYPIDSVSLDLRGQEISFEHYDSVHAQLPGCEILWDVPFQNGRISNDAQSISVTTLTEEDLNTLYNYFPGLKTLDASGCQAYDLLEAFRETRPDCEVIYEVTLGGKSFDPDVTELVLEPGDYDLDTLTANLPHLPQVAAITLKTPDLSLEQIDGLKAAFENIAITCTVEIHGVEYNTETTKLDLSALTSEEVAETCEKLAMLPGLTSVELMDADGNSALSMEDVKALKDAAPEASFHYVFDFYGTSICTTDEEVKLYGKKIGDDGADTLRAALDLMENCSRFVLEYCNMSNDVLAQLRDEYRDKTKVVWRVNFGGGSTLTDAEVIRCTYDLLDDNSHNLIYCEDVRFVDIGHNEWLDSVDFVAGMTNLEVIIISGAPVKDLTPFANCKKLRVLEAAFCNYIEDISPLAECESLEMLNISYSHVTDLSPLDNLNLTNLCAMYEGKSRIPQEEQERFDALKPDCETHYVGSQPYGSCWRYAEDEITKRDWYAEICDAFRYPNAPNNVGWYLN